MFNKLSNPLSLARILTGVSKSLNIAKEVIPIYEEIKPMASKLKGAFSFLKDINLNNNSNNSIAKKETIITNKNAINTINSINNPKFFK